MISLMMPLGTVISEDTETDQLLFEITEDQQEESSVKGGMGGRGKLALHKVLPIKLQDTLNLELLQKKKSHHSS